MASVTAIDLVNRVRRRFRHDDTSDATDAESLGILDLLNGAIADVLTSKDWRFDQRSDGVLVTKAPSPSGTVTLTEDSSLLSVGLVMIDPATVVQKWSGDIVTRLELTGDSGITRTGIRINSVRMLGALTTGLYAEIAWPLPTTTDPGKAFVSEYLLPDTVREVISVTHEGKPLHLDHVNPGATWDSLVPRPTAEYNSPEWVGVGGMDVGTHDNTLPPGEPKLRMILWPVPDDEYALHYTYYYNHPRLTYSGSTLNGVPDHIVEDIVRLAAADAMMTMEKDPSTSLAGSRDALQRSYLKFMSQDPQPAKRNPVRSWSEPRGGSRRSVHGFPGVTIPE